MHRTERNSRERPENVDGAADNANNHGGQQDVLRGQLPRERHQGGDDCQQKNEGLPRAARHGQLKRKKGPQNIETDSDNKEPKQGMLSHLQWICRSLSRGSSSRFACPIHVSAQCNKNQSRGHLNCLGSIGKSVSTLDKPTKILTVPGGKIASIFLDGNIVGFVVLKMLPYREL